MEKEWRGNEEVRGESVRNTYYVKRELTSSPSSSLILFLLFSFSFSSFFSPPLLLRVPRSIISCRSVVNCNQAVRHRYNPAKIGTVRDQRCRCYLKIPSSCAFHDPRSKRVHRSILSLLQGPRVSSCKQLSTISHTSTRAGSFCRFPAHLLHWPRAR